VKVVICGGGIAGLAAAIQISANGTEVVVLERSRGLRSQGYMVDIFGVGYDAAEAMNLLPALENVAYKPDGACLVDERGRRRVSLPYALAAKVHSGRLLKVMRSDLEKVLHDNMPGQIDLRWNSSVVDVSDQLDRVVLTLDGGERLDCDLLVGADGIHSTVRRCVFGAESMFLRYLGLRATAFVIDAPDIARTLKGQVALTDTIGRQMGFFVLRDGRVAVFGVHYTLDQDVPVDRRAAIHDAFDGLGWLVPDALELCPPSEQIYYDQIAQIEMPRWSKGRVTLLGDACCAVSLLVGQGASLGIAGAYVLAEKLRSAASPELASADYERLLHPLTLEKQKRGRTAARWLVPESMKELWLRRAALKLARLPIADRYIGTALSGKSAPLITNPAHENSSPSSVAEQKV